MVAQLPPTEVASLLELLGNMTPSASTLARFPTMKDGKRQEKRVQSIADGKRTRGPAGCQEASCGTLSFYDEQGERECIQPAG